MRVVLFTILLSIASAAFADTRYAVGVDGLACPFCAYGLEKRLLKEPGVVSVQTDISAGRLIVQMEEQATLNHEQAHEAVKDAGFTLRSFEVVEE